MEQLKKVLEYKQQTLVFQKDGLRREIDIDYNPDKNLFGVFKPVSGYIDLYTETELMEEIIGSFNNHLTL